MRSVVLREESSCGKSYSAGKAASERRGGAYRRDEPPSEARLCAPAGLSIRQPDASRLFGAYSAEMMYDCSVGFGVPILPEGGGDTGAAGCFFTEKRVPPRFSVGAMLYPCFPVRLCCVGVFRREDCAVFGLFD